MSVYAKLTFGCPPRGNSLTSNAKFISPFNDIYYEPTEPIMTYPGGYNPRPSVPTKTFQKAWNMSDGCQVCNNDKNGSKLFIKSRRFPQIISSLDAIGTDN